MIRTLPRYILVLIIVGLIVANTLVWRAALAPRVLTVQIFETGKGKAILVTTPSNHTLLIDSNSDASILRALGSSLPFWRRSIDVVIPLKSGIGLTELKKRYQLKQLLTNLIKGNRLDFHDGTFIDVLWPPENTKDAPVLLLSYGSTSFLIKPVISSRLEKYLTSLDSSLPPPGFIISSSTPANILTSSGIIITH